MITSKYLRLLAIAATVAISACSPSDGPTATNATDASAATDTAMTLPFNAGGNEPGWALTLNQQLTLNWNYGEQQLSLPLPKAQAVDGGINYKAANNTHQVKARIEPTICRDSATGMPHPYTVKVDVDHTTLHGCGGDPATLLSAHHWLVEDIANRGIIDSSHLTLVFDDQGQVSGYAGCNSYQAGYTLTGESLSIHHPAATLMACAPALNHQETLFFETLSAARRFDIDAHGKLIIYTNNSDTLTATAESQHDPLAH